MEWAVLWVACVIIATMIGQRKGEAFLGCVAGMLLGPLGVLLALFSAGNQLPCPSCQERVHKAAAVCPHCQRPIERRHKVNPSDGKIF